MTDYEKLLEEIERRTDAWARAWRASAGTSDGDERTQDVRALAAALREVMAERDGAGRDLAEYTAQDDTESAERLTRYRAVRGDGDSLLRNALGPVWTKLWGPELEKLGAVVDDLLVRATDAERMLRGTQEVLRQVNTVEQTVSAALRVALSDVEAMRAEVRDAKAEAETANDSAWGTAEELRNVRAEYEAMRVVCDAARAAYEAYVHQRPSLVRSKRWGDLHAALRALDARGKGRTT